MLDINAIFAAVLGINESWHIEFAAFNSEAENINRCLD
jgi:hypothetical protein